MRKRHFATSKVVGGILLSLLCVSRAAGIEPGDAADPVANEIRQLGKAFTDAFNRGDAKAVAAQWTEDGDYVDETGQRFHGRDAIEMEYKTFFTRHPGVKMKLEIESLRILDENNAIEDGCATLEPLPNGIRARSRYTAMHTKKNGQWLMTAVRDSQVEVPANSGRLEDLDFLVGTWSVEQDGTQFETTFRWINNKNNLERWYTAYKDKQLLSHGRQMIGWDPLAGRIVSWTFTADGSFAAGAWAPHEGSWHVATAGVMKDGTLTSSTDVWSQPDKDTLSWQSGNRAKGGQSLPDMQEVVLKRKQ